MFKLIWLESDRIYIGKIVLDLNLLYAEAEHTFIYTSPNNDNV